LSTRTGVEIADADELYRRVLPFHLRADGTVSSSAFKDRRGKPDTHISVDIATLTTIDECLARSPGMGAGVASLRAGDARTLMFAVRHDPLPDNPAHASIAGQNDKLKCRELANHCIVVRAPLQRHDSPTR
jgi:hypothetical protein